MTKFSNSYSSVKWDWFAALLFALVFCDALISYFTKRIGFYHVSVIAGVLYFVFLYARGLHRVLPSDAIRFWLLLAMFGFVIAVPVQNGIGFNRLLEVTSATVAYLIGFAFFKSVNDLHRLSWFLLAMVLLYSLISTLAILKIAPAIFPLSISLWADNGVINERPAIMTDQNFQVFYLFPAAALIAPPFHKIRTPLTIISIMCALFVLAKLQTRSGVLVMFALLVLSWILPLRVPGMGKKKFLVLPFFIAVALAYALPTIVGQSQLLIDRFTGGDFTTGLGRLKSFIYLFEKLWNPLWWIPQGNGEFVANYGNKPHSNTTAVFLEGGIFSLAAWIALLAIPLLKLTRLFLLGKLDSISSMVMTFGAACLTIQLSLNVPLMDQVWLWMGALSGGVVRMQIIERQRRKNSLVPNLDA